MSSFRVLQLKQRRFGPFWYKTTSFWMPEQFLFNSRAVQNDVVWISDLKPIQNNVVLDRFKKKKKRPKRRRFMSQRDQTTSFWPDLQKTGTFVPTIPDVGRKKGKIKRKKKTKRKKKRI